MRVLVGCECSGRVRNAFARLGHDVVSVDLAPAEDDGLGRHYQDDLRHFLASSGIFDLAIMHPECRYLAHSGVRWLYNDGRKENGKDKSRWDLMEYAADFYTMCWAVNAEHVAIENSQMHPYAKQALRDRGVPIDSAYEIQTWELATTDADNVQKRLHLLTRGLPGLLPTGVFDGSTARPECHYESPGPNRSKNRARTRVSTAEQFAIQWGGYVSQRLAA